MREMMEEEIKRWTAWRKLARVVEIKARRRWPWPAGGSTWLQPRSKTEARTGNPAWRKRCESYHPVRLARGCLHG